MKFVEHKKINIGLLVGTSIFMTACGTPVYKSVADTGAASTSTPTRVTQVMNWFAEPEQGGQWAAQLNGDYAKLGLAMTTVQGGPQISPITMVAAGKYTFGMATADSILQARAQGIPVVAIFAVFQTNPQVLIWHANSGIRSFANLNGHPVYVSSGSVYWAYLVKKYHLTKAQQMSYTGSLVPFVHNQKAVIQGYVTEEPFALRNQHVPIQYELIAESGYNPYQNVMFTTEKEIQEHPDVVRAFVEASQEGWKQYLNNPVQTDKMIQEDAPSLSDAAMMYAVKEEAPLIEGGDAKEYGIGYMSKSRWELLAQQMEGVGLLPKGFNVNGAFTDAFLPTR